MLSIFTQAQLHPNTIAILDSSGEYTYGSLMEKSAQIALHLLQGKVDLNEARVAFMVSPGINYVATLWGIWRAGGIAVPLCLSYPLPSLAYVIEDTKAAVLVVEEIYQDLLQPYAFEKGIPLLDVQEVQQENITAPFPEVNSNRGALILYTSGTTSLPKGVLSTHANLEAQISTLIHAWEWTAKDHTVCLLPLHHVHG